MLELTITLKGEDQTYKKKFLIYSDLNLNNPNDAILTECLEQAKKEANFAPESAKWRASGVI